MRLSRHRYMVGDPAGAEQAAEEAMRLLDDGVRVLPTRARWPTRPPTTGRSSRSATGRPPAAAALRRGAELARRAGRPDLVALCRNYRSIADADLDDDQRLALLRSSLSLALAHGFHETAARAYNNLTELLYRYHRLDELAAVLADGQRFVTERGFPSHAYDLAVHRGLLSCAAANGSAARGHVARAGARRADPGMLAVYSLPPYARLLARRGDPAAEPLLERAWAQATQQRMLHGLALAGTALLEWAWLNDRPDRAAAVLDAWRPHAARPGAEQPTAELLRYAARAGLPVEVFPRTARSRGPPACAATGSGPPSAGRSSATRTSGRWSWPNPAWSSRPSRPCARWRTSARTPRSGWSAGSCARSG